MGDITHQDSIVIVAPPEVVYDVVAEVTRTGEYSYVCRECWWDEGATGKVGDGFTGRNVLPDRTWETHSTVVAAERGKAFGWHVGDDFVRWMYTMEPVPEGTRLTESWTFMPAGQAFMAERFGAEAAPSEVAKRTELAHKGIPETLAALKRVIEGD